MKKTLLPLAISSLFTVLLPNPVLADQLPPKNHQTIQYEQYTAITDCSAHATDLALATVMPDTPSLSRESSNYQIDQSLYSRCTQTSTAPYSFGLRRGQLINSHFIGKTQKAYDEGYYMTNIVPMTVELYTGAWYQSDRIIDCIKPNGKMTVIAGAIWEGAHAANGTLPTHGIPVPSAYFKIIKQGAYQGAWMIPNAKTSTRETLPAWEVTVNDIENRIGYLIPAELDGQKNYHPDGWYHSECVTQ